MPANALIGLRQSWHESRAGPLAGIFWALVITIAALTAVNSASDRARQALRITASELLAADLVLRSRQPIGPEYHRLADRHGLRRADTVTFNTVVIAGNKTSLVAAKAVGQTYPLRGHLRAATRLYETGTVQTDGPRPGTLWAERRLFEQLELAPGDQVQIGDRELPLARVLTLEPDRSTGFAGLSPRVLMTMADARAAGLLRSQSRATWRLLLSGDADGLRQIRRSAAQDPDVRIITPDQAQAQSADAIDQTRSFLSIAALSAVLLGAAGMLLAMHQYTRRERHNIALWRSFGIAWRRIRSLILWRLAWLVLAASAAGILLGHLAQQLLSTHLGRLLQVELPAAGAGPLLASLAIATLLTSGLCLPPLLQLKRTPILGVIRRVPDHGGRELHRYLPGLLALALISWWQLGEWRLTLWILGSMLALVGVMAAAALLLLRLLRRSSGLAGPVWRLTGSSLQRHRHGNALHMAAVSLALLALLLLAWVRNDLLDQWQATLAPGTPNYFLINIQPAQRQALEQLLRRYPVKQLEFGPMAIARISAINGVPAAAWRPDADPPGRRDGTVNLSWRGDLPDSNRIISGRWFDRNDSGGMQISLARNWAESLALEPGHRITFEVGSETRTGTITSLREVDWDSFKINFFILIDPASAAGLDHQYIANFYLPESARGLLPELITRFPNVTVYDTNALVARVSELFGQLSRALDGLFWFTLGAALVVMLITVQSGLQTRKREVALLRCLGIDRPTLQRAWWLEQAAVGVLTGMLTVLAAALSTWWISTRTLDITWRLQADLMLYGLLAAIAVVPLFSRLISRNLFHTPPMRILQTAW